MGQAMLPSTVQPNLKPCSQHNLWQKFVQHYQTLPADVHQTAKPSPTFRPQTDQNAVLVSITSRGAEGEIRTPGLLITNQLLYP